MMGRRAKKCKAFSSNLPPLDFWRPIKFLLCHVLDHLLHPETRKQKEVTETGKTETGIEITASQSIAVALVIIDQETTLKTKKTEEDEKKRKDVETRKGMETGVETRIEREGVTIVKMMKREVIEGRRKRSE